MEIVKSQVIFLNSGGNILWLLLLVSICLWSLICNRFIFLKYTYSYRQQQWLKRWQQSNQGKHQVHFYIKRCILSEAKISMEESLPLIKMLIAICPMLGLLGTVVGMIQVFDGMAITGNATARIMAKGISQATISTMAGMVIAISGLYFHKLLEKVIYDKLHQLTMSLK